MFANVLLIERSHGLHVEFWMKQIWFWDTVMHSSANTTASYHNLHTTKSQEIVTEHSDTQVLRQQ